MLRPIGAIYLSFGPNKSTKLSLYLYPCPPVDLKWVFGLHRRAVAVGKWNPKGKVVYSFPVLVSLDFSTIVTIPTTIFVFEISVTGIWHS